MLVTLSLLLHTNSEKKKKFFRLKQQKSILSKSAGKKVPYQFHWAKIKNHPLSWVFARPHCYEKGRICAFTLPAMFPTFFGCDQHTQISTFIITPLFLVAISLCLSLPPTPSFIGILVRNCTRSVDCFEQYGHFNVNSSSPWTGYIF